MRISCRQSVHANTAHIISIQENNVPVNTLPLSTPLTICAYSMGRQLQGTIQQQQLWLLHTEFQYKTP